MKTIHLVSHTHWDREWYLTFQQFRFRLVRLMDRLLDLLDTSDFFFFTLDGQTIVLDDYLEIRPEQADRIRRLAQAGKLLIGPWYILPDEFLEGPEAMVRNLLFGRRGCRRFTAELQPMERIGYIPDPFGHISQLPQIAAGFQQDALCFWRGVGEAPTEFRWAAPDGTERLVLHLHESYGNGALLPPDPDGFSRTLATQADTLTPHATTSHLLIMVGTDHMEPHADLPANLPAAEAALGARVLQSTLPAYLAAVQAELGPDGLAALPLRHGEMRSPQRAHLLPAVLAARTWIKQWNTRCETLLTRWAEPFSALAEQLDGNTGRRAFLRRAWDWLLQNHPHDSICGCSVDQVHQEMRTRFAWSEQMADLTARSSLEAIAAQVDTAPDPSAPLPAIVVFNPTAAARSGRVRALVEPAPDVDVALIDPDGQAAPYRVVQRTTREQFSQAVDRDTLTSLLGMMAASGGQVGAGLFPRRLDLRVAGSVAHLDVWAGGGGADADVIAQMTADLQAALANPGVQTFQVRVLEEASLEIELLARDVPGLGYKAYRLEPSAAAPEAAGIIPTDQVENEFFRVQADPATGTVTITDKETGWVLPGLNRLVDGGDRGDEYTFTSPENDRLIDRPAEPPVIQAVHDGLGPELVVSQVYRLPRALADDRSQRSDETVDVPISSRIRLTPGVRRVEFETTVDNRAGDHRLRVHFPTPVVTGSSWAEGHFDVVERPIALPADTAGWAEQPTGCQPQLGFVDVTDGQRGVMLINRGLPEYEALSSGASGLPAGAEGEGVTLALTLLRCVGWLSRGDLPNRQGHAGPFEPTPEAQCQGEHTFHYALAPHAGNYLTAHGEAAALNAGLRAMCTAGHGGPLPPQGSFVEIWPAAVALSAVKPPEEGDGLIIRVYNAAPVPVEARLRLWRPFREAALVPLSEGEPLAVLATESDQVTLPLRPKEIATLRFS